MLEQIDAAASQAKQVYEHMVESKEIMGSIKAQGNVMFRVMREYQKCGFSQEQAFELVKAQAADFKVQLG